MTRKRKKVILSGELCVSCKMVKLDKKGGIRPYICETCADVIKRMVKNGCMV